MGLNQACYLPAPVDKIFGVLENNIVKFNATTGAKEASAKIASPLYGPCTCVAGSGVVYVGMWADYSYNDDTTFGVSYQNKGVYNVDPTTLAITNFFEIDRRIQQYQMAVNDNYYYLGPTDILVHSDGYLYVNMHIPTVHWLDRYDVANANNNTVGVEIGWPGPASSAGYVPEQITVFDYGGGKHIYLIDIPGLDLDDYEILADPLPPATSPFNLVSSADISPYYLNACVYCSGTQKIYAVDGTENLFKSDADNTNHQILNLGAVWANVKPFRIRYNAYDGLLYIPAQTEDVVIVWNPATDTGIAKSGLDSPVDVVFTPTKKFAVQSGVAPLKEIV